MWRSPVYRFMTPSDFRDETMGGNPLTRPSIRSITRALEERSTAHGLPNLNKARGIVKQCFWALAILLMLCGLVYNVRGLFVEYLRYDVSVSISIQQKQQLTFPSVTICNMSPVKKSAMTTNNSISNILERRKREADNGNNNNNKTVEKRKREVDNNAVLSSNREATAIADNKDNEAVSLHNRIVAGINKRAKKITGPVDNRWKREIVDSDNGARVSRKRGKRSTETCYRGWNLRNGFCYYVPPGNVTGGLVESYALCVELGGNLASILNEAEQDYVTSLSTDTYNLEYWFGLLRFPVSKNNVTTPRLWWTDGAAVNYLNTLANETIDYTKYFYIATNGLWLSSYPNVSRSVICKMPANATKWHTTSAQTTKSTKNIAPTTSAGLTTTRSITYATTGNIPLTTTRQPYSTSTRSQTTSTVAQFSTTRATSTTLKSTGVLSTTVSPETSSTMKTKTTTLFDSVTTPQATTTSKGTSIPTTTKGTPTTTITKEITSPPSTKVTSTATTTKETTTPTTTKTTPIAATKKETTTPITTKVTPSTAITTETTIPTTSQATPTTTITKETTTSPTTKGTPTTSVTTETTTPITTGATSTLPTTTETTPQTTPTTTTELTTPITITATSTTTITEETIKPTSTQTTTLTIETTMPTSTEATSTSTPQVPTADSTPLESSTSPKVPSTETTPAPTEFETTTAYIATTITTTTTSATTVHPEAPPIGCCCRCCSAGGQLTGDESCAFCTDAKMDGAVVCAVNKSSPLATPLSQEPNFEAAGKLNGSRFPERLAVTESFQENQQLTETLAGLPEEVKVGMGYSREEFILDCRYDGDDCQKAIDFTEFYNPIHGNCYVFNSGWTNRSNLYIATQPGRGHGLKLWLNILQEEYTPQSGDTAGAVVLIQSQNEMPFPEDEGIILSPGHLTSISVTQQTISKMSSPFSNCTDDIYDDTQRNVYAENYPVEYTVTSCQKTCYQRMMIERCHCTDPYVPAFEADVNSSIPVCLIANMTQDDCSYAVRKMFAANTLSCACPERCSDTRFSVKSSMAAWPNNKQKETALRKLAAKTGESGNFFDPGTVDDNLLTLEIYFETFHYESIIESPSYPLINLISDIGGVVGLWFGFAFMTFIEFFEYFVDLFVLLGKRLFRNCSH